MKPCGQISEPDLAFYSSLYNLHIYSSATTRSLPYVNILVWRKHTNVTVSHNHKLYFIPDILHAWWRSSGSTAQLTRLWWLGWVLFRFFNGFWNALAHGFRFSKHCKVHMRFPFLNIYLIASFLHSLSIVKVLHKQTFSLQNKINFILEILKVYIYITPNTFEKAYSPETIKVLNIPNLSLVFPNTTFNNFTLSSPQYWFLNGCFFLIFIWKNKLFYIKTITFAQYNYFFDRRHHVFIAIQCTSI